MMNGLLKSKTSVLFVVNLDVCFLSNLKRKSFICSRMYNYVTGDSEISKFSKSMLNGISSDEYARKSFI